MTALILRTEVRMTRAQSRLIVPVVALLIAVAPGAARAQTIDR
jgi:hypothetical protein